MKKELLTIAYLATLPEAIDPELDAVSSLRALLVQFDPRNLREFLNAAESSLIGSRRSL